MTDRASVESARVALGSSHESAGFELGDKRALRRLAIMIESGLIWWEHYVPWADDLIVRLEKPPVWLIDLSLTKYSPDALRSLNTVASSEPFVKFDTAREGAEHVACLYLRYERRELSWATFLHEAGAFLDGSDGPVPCEYMYSRLTDLRHAEFSAGLEHQHAAEVLSRFRDAIDSVRVSLAPFLQKFRKALSSP